MLEQIGNGLTFYAFFVDSKLGATALTVTTDVFRNGTLIVTAGSATEVGDGLYSYALASGSVTVEGVYIAVFKTATTTVDQRHLASAYLVGTAGIEFLDAAVTSRSTLTAGGVRSELTTELGRIDAAVSTRLSSAGYTAPPAVGAVADAVWDEATAGHVGVGSTGAAIIAAGNTGDPWAAALPGVYTDGQAGEIIGNIVADVWERTPRTLTQSAASVASTVAGPAIVAVRGDTWTKTLTGLGSLVGRTKFWFTVKRDLRQTDAESTMQIVETAGLLRLNGAAGTAGNGSLTVLDEIAGNVAFRVEAVEMAKLEEWAYTYDLQLLESDGITTRSWTNTSFSVVNDTTRAVA